MTNRRAWLAVLGTLVCGATLSADTIYLRDGRRIEGVLVGIRGGVVEFERRGFFGREAIRIDRDDVRRIEFDERPSRDDFDDRDRDRDRNGDNGRDDRGGRPSGMRERVVSVDGATSWNDTGVDVRA